MQADIVFHPYIYAMTGKDDIARHYQLETNIDMYFVSAGQSDCNRKLADIVTPETEKTLISVAELLFASGGELPRQAISDALRLHIRFQAMYSSLFWKLVVRLLGSLLGTPFSQQRHLFYPVNMNQKQIFGSLGGAVEWRHPVTGEINCSTVNDLADQAVKQTIEVFRRIEALQSLAAALSDPPGCNLLTGMFAVNSSKMFSSGSVGTFQTTNKNCKVSG
jgi:hypothetical protein